MKQTNTPNATSNRKPRKKSVIFTRTNDYPNYKAGDYAPTETKIRQNRKEDHYFGGLSAVAKTGAPTVYNPGGMSPVIDARFYGAGKYPARIYCCVWINFPPTKKYPEGISVSGGGYAGGYGYDRKSAAFAAALDAAGVKLPWSLSGTGQNDEAIRDICHAAGIKKFSIISAHG